MRFMNKVWFRAPMGLRNLGFGKGTEGQSIGDSQCPDLGVVKQDMVHGSISLTDRWVPFTGMIIML